ncbi:hydroxysqualene dehydroxylase HpnE [Neisseria leonii]|uniref:hydroxysqualene dehydroxylase HpnE n=1 Tax=Neisseria leonii TaxID=2995413 RepID=UPI00237AB7EE|nr:hydroxysqualene dehydroxylase HpnE [Neisseria sp. 3986]MDD9326083.1 hydroxysqualene dehydroxylase HpnE [Neisseria sp. 3986]
MSARKQPKIAVIGAGWSGLAAAVYLSGRADLTVFEAGRTAGGRARTLAGDQAGFRFLDNGQHILMGAYRSVAELMDKIGSPAGTLRQLPLQWYLADGLQFQTADLPAPWHLLAGIARARGIGWYEKWQLLRQMAALKKETRDVAAAVWLRECRCPPVLVRDFWQPLIWGALNTPLEQAGIQFVRAVLQDGVWADKNAAQYWLPQSDLGSIVPEPAVRYLREQGADLRFSQRVSRLKTAVGRKVAVDGEWFDGVVLAVAPYHGAAMLPEEMPEEWVSAWRNTAYHAITTVYLRYGRAFSLPAPMTGLADATVQWFIAREDVAGQAQEVAAVISVSDRLPPHDTRQWAAAAHRDLLRLVPNLPEPQAVRVITEKRATAASTAGRRLPDCTWLHRQGIYPAGDWLHPRYPATLEAAVQSGRAAAEMMIDEYGM